MGDGKHDNKRQDEMKWGKRKTQIFLSVERDKTICKKTQIFHTESLICL